MAFRGFVCWLGCRGLDREYFLFFFLLLLANVCCCRADSEILDGHVINSGSFLHRSIFTTGSSIHGTF